MSSTDSPAVTLQQQVASLPAYVLTAWRGRYASDDSIDLEARAVLNQEATALRARGVQVDALAVWMRLADAIVRGGEPSRELSAAAALAGLAARLRPQGFDAPRPSDAEAR